jgi:hypothetical protein
MKIFLTVSLLSKNDTLNLYFICGLTFLGVTRKKFMPFKIDGRKTVLFFDAITNSLNLELEALVGINLIDLLHSNPRVLDTRANTKKQSKNIFNPAPRISLNEMNYKKNHPLRNSFSTLIFRVCKLSRKEKKRILMKEKKELLLI